MANYASFSDESTTIHSFFLDSRPEANIAFDPRIRRNFDQLISQRQEEATGETHSQFYSSVFENIKEKLFIVSETDEIELTDSEKNEYNSKYTDGSEIISILKKQIADIYMKKSEHEVIVQEKKRLYTTFCNNMTSYLNTISEISNEPEDIQFKELLNNRINWYYQKLDLENLINTENQLKKEFSFLKKTIKQIINISPTICSICMENQVGYYIVPCGHTMCGQCKTNTERNKKCHYCRQEKTNVCKLYL